MTMRKIAVTTSSFGEFDDRPIEVLKENGFTIVFNEKGKTLKQGEILGLLKGCRGVIAGTETYDAAVLDKLPDLRVISRCGAGTDNVDLGVCKTRGIKGRAVPWPN